MFGLSDKLSDEELIKSQYTKPHKKALELYSNGKHQLRLVEPLLADEDCLACHSGTKKGEALGVMDIVYSFDEIDGALSDLGLEFLFIFMVALLVTVFLLMFVLNYVVKRPVEELMLRSRDLAHGDGDLTKRVAVDSSDEFGKVSSYINRFIDKIQATIKSSQYISKQVDQNSGVLNKNALKLSSSSKEQSLQAKDAHELTNEVEADIEGLKSLAQNAFETNEVANELLADMVKALKGVVVKIDQTSSSEHDMVHSMESLVEQTSQIHGVINLIKDIADQTSLLALNAAVEAARAGEHGRGFAVVASEVRSLAEKTHKSLSEIDTTVSLIVQGIHALSQSMGENSHKIVELKTGADNLNQKASATQEKTRESMEVSKRSSSEAKGVVEKTKILQAKMKKTLDISEDNKEIADGLLKISSELKSTADSLEQSLSSFKS